MKKFYLIFAVLFSLSSGLQAQDAADPGQENIFPGTNIQAEDIVITNEQHLREFLTDFRNGARFYKVNYTPTLADLSKVVLIKAELNFLGGIVEIDGKKEVWLNSILLQYPYLYKMIFYRQFGKLYGLEEAKGGSMVNIMTDRWEINPEYENYAYRLSQNHTWKRMFFESLADKFPLEKKL